MKWIHYNIHCLATSDSSEERRKKKGSRLCKAAKTSRHLLVCTYTYVLKYGNRFDTNKLDGLIWDLYSLSIPYSCCVCVFTCATWSLYYNYFVKSGERRRRRSDWYVFMKCKSYNVLCVWLISRCLYLFLLFCRILYSVIHRCIAPPP